MFDKPPSFAADRWPGNSLLTGGKGYAPTPMGQVHYRDIGPADSQPVVLLMHQSQMSMVQYALIQDDLAAVGLRSLAVDTPGHGMSDLPRLQPTLPQLADNLIPVLDHLKIDKVIAAGHHSGAALAASLAARYPDRVAGAVLHGSVMFDAAEGAAWLASPLYDRTPRPDGSHMGAWFRPFQGDIVGDAATLEARTWMILSLFMMGPDVGKPAVFTHDMARDIERISVPTLILTDLEDPVYPKDLRVAQLRPDFAYEVFSPHGAMTMMNQPQRWVRIVAAFAADAVSRSG
jgi:pimeloyl-ACP methyl ester carboxylesterase